MYLLLRVPGLVCRVVFPGHTNFLYIVNSSLFKYKYMNIYTIHPFLFGRSFLQMLFINAKALFMRFYVLSMNFVSVCLNIVLSHAFSE